MSPILRNQLYALLYFALSTLLTWWFVVVSPLYISNEQMILSTAVAGGKWAIQIIGAFFLLGEKRWVFIKNIGFVCLVGSCILMPYVILSTTQVTGSAPFFIGSLILSVMTMIVMYHRAIKQSDVHISWWYFWLICLSIAVSLQLTVVFNAIG